MSEWAFLTLEEAGVQLLDCAHKTPAAQATGLPYVAIPQLKKGEIDLSDARRISVTDFEEWTKKADPQAYDMVLSRRCNPGETAYVRPGMRFALGQNLVLLRANSKRVRPEFLRWIVRSPYWWAEINKFLNVGAVFDSLRCADVPKFSLPIPPLRHQDAISSLLGAIDDKIDLSRRMNETLEAMARAIFKDWFVDFGPTRAKAEGRAPYLAPKIWALFPERLDDDDKPEGWVIKKVGDVIERLGVGKKYEQKTVFPKVAHSLGGGASRRGDFFRLSLDPAEKVQADRFVDFGFRGEEAIDISRRHVQLARDIGDHRLLEADLPEQALRYFDNLAMSILFLGFSFSLHVSTSTIPPGICGTMAIARDWRFPQCLISPAYNEKLVWGCAIFCVLRTATRHFIHVSRRHDSATGSRPGRPAVTLEQWSKSTFGVGSHMAKEKNFTRGPRIRCGGQTGADRAALDADIGRRSKSLRVAQVFAAQAHECVVYPILIGNALDIGIVRRVRR